MLPSMRLQDIPNRLAKIGKKQADLSRVLELDPSSLTKTIKGTRNVQASEIPLIEQFFSEKLDLDDGGAKRTVGSGRRAHPPHQIPVYGYAAAGGGDRIAFSQDNVLEYREPPPYWSGAGQLIYVRIIGDSMERRYFSGEVVAVRLGVPPGKNDDCLIEFHDGSVLIKNYGGERDQTIFARQYNPEQELKIPGADVRALHAVWRPGLI